MKKELEDKYLNYYHCPRCGHEWTDTADCECDDRCPECNATASPYESEEL